MKFVCDINSSYWAHIEETFYRYLPYLTSKQNKSQSKRGHGSDHFCDIVYLAKLGSKNCQILIFCYWKSKRNSNSRSWDLKARTLPLYQSHNNPPYINVTATTTFARWTLLDHEWPPAMELFRSRRWRLDRPSQKAVVFMFEPQKIIQHMHGMISYIAVWLLGRSSC